MAYHIRKQIREKIKTYLQTISGFEDKVFFDNPDVIDANDIPCIYVTSETENIDYTNVSSGPRSQTRKLQIAIIAFVKSNKNLQDKIDELNYNIEYALSKDREHTKLDGLAIMVNLLSIDFEYLDDNEKNSASLRFTYEVNYRTLENDTSISI